MSDSGNSLPQSTLLARKGEAVPTDARLSSENAPLEPPSFVDKKNVSEIASIDLNSLIRRRGGANGGDPAEFRPGQMQPPVTDRPRPDLLPLAIMAKGFVGGAASQPATSVASQSTGANGSNGAGAAPSRKRRQLTLRLWPEEFDRLRAVAMIAHTSYQEVLASAAAIFLDHVLPRGASANEESVANGWQRLKSGTL